MRIISNSKSWRRISLVWMLMFFLTSCAGRQWNGNNSVDKTHAFLGRTIADTVDRVDAVFGEPRVEDRQRKVRVELGLGVKAKEGGEYRVRTKFKSRIPLPALERKANVFLDIGGGSRSRADSLDPDLEEYDRKALTSLGFLSLKKWPLSYGVRLRTRWDDGPQVEIKPFLRWEDQKDPWRFYLNQEVYYKTDDKFGTVTSGHVDYILNPVAFFRFFSEGEIIFERSGVYMEHAVHLRQSLKTYGALSYEVGMSYNTANIEKEGETYAQIRLRKRVWRPWLELDLKPRMVVHWKDEKADFSVFGGFTVVFEEFLPRKKLEHQEKEE
jgi:hypothetical protein